MSACPEDGNYKRRLRGKNYGKRETLACNQSINAAAYGTLYCTRRKNHMGKHHFHTTYNNRCLKRWTTAEAVIEAL